MTTEALIDALQHLKVETGSLACAGCGHEHNCSTKGCAILREASERLGYLSDAFTEETALKLSSQIFDTTPERLRDLVKADKEGRLEEYPCKLGSTVWMIVTMNYNPNQNLHLSYYVKKTTATKFNVERIRSELGKTVFFDKMEAIERMLEMRNELRRGMPGG